MLILEDLTLCLNSKGPMPWAEKARQRASQGPPVPRLPPSLEAHSRINTAIGINYAAGLFSISPTTFSLLKSSYRSQEEYESPLCHLPTG